MKTNRVASGLLLLLCLGAGESLQAQGNPTAPAQRRGLGASPTFEGWYRNPDGTYTLSFGFMNRNTEQILDIPVGPRNFVAPGPIDQGQPTYFTPRRSYGVFAVTVPADFGREARVTWTLEANGERYAVTGGLIQAYETDNLYARGTNRRPPVVVLVPGGVESKGPNGAWVGPVSARVGEPLALQLSAWDEDGRDVTLRWYKYRGTGDVSFAQDRVPVGEGSTIAATTATFAAEGDYVIYVRADHSDASVSGAGLEQCCWTNGYVRVSVSR